MKNRLYLIPIILYLYGCSAGYDGEPLIDIPLGTPLASPTAVLFGTATPSPTVTQIPSPTIDSAATTFHAQETAVSAVQTADSYAREGIAATNDHEQRLHDEYMIGQQNLLAGTGATASAYPTIMAGTSTQQAINNTAIANQQAIINTAAAMTQGAPAQLIAMADAQAVADTAQFNQIVELVATLGVGLLALVLSIVVWKLVISGKDYKPPEPIEEPFRIPNLAEIENKQIIPSDHPAAIRAEINRNTDTPYPSQDIYTIPCTPKLMQRLAEGVILEGKPLGTNHWEGGKDPLFTRDTYFPVRNWIQQNKFSVSRRQGRLDPSDTFLVILTTWLETKALPPGYNFDPKLKEIEDKPTPPRNDQPRIGEDIQPINKQIPEGV